MQAIIFTPCALNANGVSDTEFFNEGGALQHDAVLALFNAAKTGAQIDGKDVYQASLVSANNAAGLHAGNYCINDRIAPNEDLRRSYITGSAISGATISGGKVQSGGEQTVSITSVTLTPAVIKSLKASPVVLVAAPGVGFALIPLQLIFITRNSGNVAYTTGAGGGAEGPQLCFNGDFASSPFTAIDHSMLTANGLNEMNVITSPNAWGANLLSAFENQPLTLAGTGTEEYAVGTGTVEATLTYLKVAI